MDRKNYIILGFSGLNHKYIKDILNERGMIELDKRLILKDEIKYIDLVIYDYLYMGNKYDREYKNRTEKIKKSLINITNEIKYKVCNKKNLYFNMKRYYPDICDKYFAKTYMMNELNRLGDDKSYILKPASLGFFRSKGIEIFKNKDSLIKHVKNMNKLLYKKYIVSEYIDNIYLFRGRKFHLRMYILASTYTRKVYLLEKGRIIYSNKPYNNNIKKKDVHLTVNSEEEMIFPDDFGELDSKKIIMQMKRVIDKISDLLFRHRPYLESYEDSKYGFEVFGCDFLVKEDMSIILMEINDKVEYVEEGKSIKNINEKDGPYSDKYNNFCKTYYEWFYEKGIKPVFEGKKSKKKVKSDIL